MQIFDSTYKYSIDVNRTYVYAVWNIYVYRGNNSELCYHIKWVKRRKEKKVNGRKLIHKQIIINLWMKEDLEPCASLNIFLYMNLAVWDDDVR